MPMNLITACMPLGDFIPEISEIDPKSKLL
jgi:hypothetical protein